MWTNLLTLLISPVYSVKHYKILTGKYDMVAVGLPNLSIAYTVITRSNDLRLQENRTRYDLR